MNVSASHRFQEPSVMLFGAMWGAQPPYIRLCLAVRGGGFNLRKSIGSTHRDSAASLTASVEVTPMSFSSRSLSDRSAARSIRARRYISQSFVTRSVARDRHRPNAPTPLVSDKAPAHITSRSLACRMATNIPMVTMPTPTTTILLGNSAKSGTATRVVARGTAAVNREV